ncbi:MAG: hypothetical protein HQL18_04400 [Candidatus Omnitrophica bacterium]|nr:hypothetical protein [Candidatus Omnitrophota bacterium]
MAILFLVLIVVGLIFLAMTLNWGRLATNRAQMSMGAQSAAATLAAYMGSYGESVMQTQLGGRRKKCAWSGLLQAFLMFLIVVMLVIITIFCPPVGGLSIALVVMCIAAVVLAAAAVVIQATMINPALTQLWNSMASKNQTIDGQFYETAAQNIFQLAVSDTKTVTDKYDFNMNKDHTDSVGRFAYYYTMRMWGQEAPECAAFRLLQDELRKTLDGLGIVEPQSCTCDRPAVCDPCCQPEASRPDYCTNPDDPIDITARCIKNPIPGYYLAYDPLYCTYTAAGDNLLKAVGMDDTNKYGHHQNNDQTPYDDEADAGGAEKFMGQDSVPGDSLISLLWTLRDSVVNVKDFSAPPGAGEPGWRWCPGTAQGGMFAPSVAADPDMADALKNDITALNLTACIGADCCVYNMAGKSGAVDVSGNLIVDGSGSLPPANDGQVIDGVDTLTAFLPKINATAAELEEDRVGMTDPIWSPGVNFTGDAPNILYPYQGIGAGVNPNDPGVALPANNHSLDDLDAVGIKLRHIVTDMSSLASMNGCSLADNESWRAKFKHDLTADDDWLTILGEIAVSLHSWQTIVNNWASSGAYADDKYWCVPTNRPVDISAPEWAAAGSGSGSLDNVLSCLSWNVEDKRTLPNGNTAVGNDQKFTACSNECDDAIKSANVAARKAACESQCANDALFASDPTPCNAFCDRTASAIPGDPSGAGIDLACKAGCDTNNPDNIANRLACYSGCHGGDNRSLDSAVACTDLPRALNHRAGNLSDIYAAQGCSPELKKWLAQDQTVTTTLASGATVTAILPGAIKLAADQVQKLRKRYKYLNAIKSKLTRYHFGQYANVVDTEIPLLEAANKCVDNAANKTSNNPNGPEKIRYVWRTDPAQGDTVGTWHIVQAQAALPKRCGEPVKPGANCAGRFPWVKAYTKSWGFKRCYEMWDHSGRVGAKVERYDGDSAHDIKFANGLPLWHFRYSGRNDQLEAACGAGSNGFNPDYAYVSCRDCDRTTIVGCPGITAKTNSFVGRLEDNPTCAAAVEQIFVNGAGVMSAEMCGRYKLGGSDSHGVYKVYLEKCQQ